MKKAKVGEKIMRPMFPRLHVNDTEKGGGPRAPPRNKMALYEQLNIPSQKFNQGWLPVIVDSDNQVHPPSSSQVSGTDRKSFLPLQLPLSNPTFLPEKLSGLESGRSNTDTSVALLGQQNKTGDGDDFTVAVFVCSHKDQVKNKSETNDPEKKIRVANVSEPRRDFPLGTTLGSEDASEASILDSISAMDISPDDIVGIMGQKQFWKARRAIVNQQRVFAVQVFELHRLIKVQKLIAASPHLLEDTSTTLSKPSSNSSPVGKLLVENHSKSSSSAKKRTREPRKPNHHLVEFSAENAVVQPSVFTNKGTSSCPPTVSSLGTQCPPQHQGPGQQQLLIPVMSPTEGLVYKPFPGLPFSGTGFPWSYCYSPIMMSNFGSPAYGHPAIQGVSFIPGIPHAGHSYFPTYGMPVMTVGDSSQGSGFTSANEHVKGPAELQNLQLQSTSTGNNSAVPEPAPTPARPQVLKVSNIHGSTGSSTANDRTDPAQTDHQSCTQQSQDGKDAKNLENVWSMDGRNELPLFPVAPTTTADADFRSTQIIRAVPHNAKTASASAAWIFMSIQEERRQCDST
ncbi:hypothetical protein SAY86_023035 [Trapa natans]|uniref:Protein EARLY FLOWERING 3 n=1 Tax=Trapa natans TaxID=22666 RepID=A0AAN7LUF0_TRANT|nr:hypothetical protein SAY86_023035 [Trapa natans]